MSHGKHQVICFPRPADWTPPHNSTLPPSMIYCEGLWLHHAVELARRLNADELQADRGRWFTAAHLLPSKSQRSGDVLPISVQHGLPEAADRGEFNRLVAVVECSPERCTPQVVFIGPAKDAKAVESPATVTLPIAWDFTEGGAA